MKREKYGLILNDLKKKMVFVIGPRQVGKTWLAKEIMNEYSDPEYLNYDNILHRKIIHDQSWLSSRDLLVFDEIHKMKGWKNYLKGVYDTKPSHQHLLVTGSARMDTFQQAGDSLAGRFYKHHLMPITLSELSNTNNVKHDSFERLIISGGFPEPFLSEDPHDIKRWRNLYSENLIREDVLDFEAIHDFQSIKYLVQILQQRVGSPISIQTIANDLSITHKTIQKYILILEALYIIFRVPPWSKDISRPITKQSKYYFFDTGMVAGDKGAILENITAVALKSHAYSQIDIYGIPAGLYYLRTRNGNEVDFCFVEKNAVSFIMEVKSSDSSVSKSLRFFSNNYNCNAIQLVQDLKQEREEGLITVRKAESFLKSL